jgi:hypothetical protein
MAIRACGITAAFLANTTIAAKAAKIRRFLKMNDNSASKKTIGGMDTLPGVACGVASCKYHGTSDCCNAHGITVQNDKAQRKGETFCSTFIPRAAD